MKKAVGYIASDSFQNGFVSHQFQNQTIKNFLSNQNYIFMLSWTEYKGCAPQVLKSLLQENFYDGICFYSIEQLLVVSDASALFQQLKNSGAWIGFARENIFFEGQHGFNDCLKLWWLLKNTANRVPVSLS